MTSGRDLLNAAIEAHGGLARWRSVGEIVVRARSGGLALPARFKPGEFKAYEARISTASPRTVITPFPKPGRRGVFEGDSIRIESESSAVLAECVNARAAFRDLRHRIWWNHLDALYFAGYALWNYLNAPFLLSRPGFEVREIEPWEGDGERWRRLHVTFPLGIPTHSREQVFYFDAAGRLRRHDYTAEVFGSWAKAAHYSWGHTEFSGLLFPVHRRVYPRKRSGHPRRGPTLVWIEIDSVTALPDERSGQQK
jgi:hypothetical protein